MRSNAVISLAGLSAVPIVVTTLLCNQSHADLVFITADRAEWESAVGPFATIDFVGFPQGTEIDDQYAERGVHFPGAFDQVLLDPGFQDGAGLHNVTTEVFVTFDTPQLWFASDFLGLIRYQLLWRGELIYESDPLGGSSLEFVGLEFDRPFDSVIVSAADGGPVILDDLHFGVPAPPALWLFAGAWLLGNRRRRR